MSIRRESFKTKMAASRAEALLEKTELSSFKSCNTIDLQEVEEGEKMVHYLMDSRRRQKQVFRQLCLVDDLVQLLIDLKSVDQFLNEPGLPKPGNEARSAWKALKAKFQEGTSEVEELICALGTNKRELQEQRKKLASLLSALQKKKAMCIEKERMAAQRNQRAEKEIRFQLEDSLHAAQNKLQVCDQQLAKLKEEEEKWQTQISAWRLLREGQQTLVAGTLRNTPYRLLSVSPSELCLELSPHSSEKALEPLRVSVTISSNDEYHLRLLEGTAGLVEEMMIGPLKELSTALLDVMERYISQGEMLSEIQALHSRFAIDWCPSKRLLIFLKSASTVCHLRVEEGYPSHGRAVLLSVKKDGCLLDITDVQFQPPAEQPVLTEWLAFLSSNPII